MFYSLVSRGINSTIEGIPSQQLTKCLQKLCLSAKTRDGTFCNKKIAAVAEYPAHFERFGHRTARELFCSDICCPVTNKVTFWSVSYSACVVYTKTIIHLSVGESGAGYLPRRFVAR